MSMLLSLKCTVVSATALVCFSVLADHNLIPNGSFEGGDETKLGQYKSVKFSSAPDSLPGGWQGEGSCGWALPGTWYSSAKDGRAAAYMQTSARIFNSFVAPYDGNYEIKFYALARASFTGLGITTRIDDTVVIGKTSITEASKWKLLVSTNELSAGEHVFSIAGTDPVGDQCVAVDLISITPLPLPKDQLTVEGVPQAVGTVNPAYGTTRGLAAGSERTCTVTAEAGFSCAGWKLYRFDEENLAWVFDKESDASSKTTCAYVHGTTAGKLVWHWKVPASITTSAMGGGTVRTDGEAFIGEELTLTAIPDEGCAFDHWEGDVPEGCDENAATLAFVIGEAPVALTAVFVLAGETPEIPSVGNLIANGSFEGGDESKLNKQSNINSASFDSLPGGWTAPNGGAGWAIAGTWCAANPGPKDGKAVAYLQMNSTIENSFVAPLDGEYEVSYYAMARPKDSGGHVHSGLGVITKIDDATVLAETKINDAAAWLQLKTIVSLSAGEHVFSVVGHTDGADLGVAIDCVSVSFYAPFADSLAVEGSPTDMGTPDPGYGLLRGLAAGATRTCTAPSAIDADGFSANCAGWKLYRYNQAKGWLLAERSTETTCAYRHGETAGRLVWLMNGVAEVRTSVSGDGAGTVRTSANSVGYGELVTCEAVADEGSVFVRWEGDVSAGDAESPVVSVAAGMKAIAVTAVFASVGGTAEDLEYVGSNDGSWSVAENWSPAKVPTPLDTVTISGRRVVCDGDLKARSVTVVGSGASLKVGDGIADLNVAVGKDFLVSEGATVVFTAGRTAGVVATDWENSAKLIYAKATATAVRIGGLLKVGAGSTLVAANDKLTGTPVIFKTKDFILEQGATADAAGRGFSAFAKSDWTAGGAPVGAAFGVAVYYSKDADYYSYGFGRGLSYSIGAGAGAPTGVGVSTYTVKVVSDETGGTTSTSQKFGADYGYPAAAFLPGSPRGVKANAQSIRAGGGSFCVFATGKATVNGAVRADAEDTDKANYGDGGASGGSVWIAAKEMSVGRSAELTARGGNSSGSATGGGGRITLTAGATQAELDLFASGETPSGFTVTDIAEVNLSVDGGNKNANGNAGTAVFTFAGARVIPTLVTAEGDEAGSVSPPYGFNVFDRTAIPEFSFAGGGAAVYDPAYRNLRRSCLTKVVFEDQNGPVDSLATAVGTAKATWRGSIEGLLRLKVVGGGSVSVNGTAYAADAEIWLGADEPVALTAVDGSGAFVRFVGDIPGGQTAERAVSVPARAGMIVQAVFADATAGEKAFVGADGDFWDVDANWEPAGIPTAVDAVTVTKAVKCHNVLAAGTLAVDGGKVLVGGKAETDVLHNGSTAPDEYVCSAGLRVVGDMTVCGAGEVILGARLPAVELQDVEIGGSLTLDDTATLTVHARAYPEDGEKDDRGRPVLTNFYRTAQVVKVGRALTLAGSSTLVPDCDIWTGNPVRFEVGGTVTVGAEATVNARRNGFGWVDGKTLSATAGSDQWRFGGTYAGDPYAPYAPGAPSGVCGTATRGGGVIWIKTPGRIVLDGTLDASGVCRIDYPGQSGTEGGSSGGGIWLVCSRMEAGETALAKSCGGPCSKHDEQMANERGGSGGAIAVAFRMPAEKLEKLAAGEKVKAEFADEIELFETDVSGLTNAAGTANRGASGTTATVTGIQGFGLFVR